MGRRASVRTVWANVAACLGLVAGILLVIGCPQKEAPPTGGSRPLRVLLVGDPFGVAIQRARSELEKLLKVPLELEVVGYNENFELLRQAARDLVSVYDLASFDVVWLGKLVEEGVLEPLPPNIGPRPAAYFPGTLETCRHGGRLYGLPIQPHSELLWIRKDWFEAEGLGFPETTDEVLEAARRFHAPEKGRYGIAWNAQRGVPLGQSMAHFFAAFGQPLLDERGLPAFKTERGLRAARYALALRDVSPPDILQMAWDQRVSRFAEGVVAMTYGWGARSFMVEESPVSKVRGVVAYGAPPHAPDAPPVIPLGVWAMGIPANASRKDESARVLGELLSPASQRLLIPRGQCAPALIELLGDHQLQRRYPVFAAMMALRETHQFSAEMRPAVPQWDQLCDVLGTVFHDMLRGRLSPEEALAESERRAHELFEQP